MSLISNLNSKTDDLIELNKDSFKNNSFNFNIPKNNGMNKGGFIDDGLFNKKKISDDVISMSSRSSRASSSAGNSNYDKAKYMKNMKNIYKNKKLNRDNDMDSTSGSDASSVSGRSDVTGSSSGSGGSGDSRGSGERRSRNRDDTSESGESGESGKSQSGSESSSGESRVAKRKHMSAKDIVRNEINEKREIIYQLERLESKGFKLPFKFNMNSDLEEMRSEYNRIIREKELDGSVRFQQKMLMAFVSGSEYMNTRYDPFSIKLDGWSEQVNENINDYDDIFEELHYKYKSSGKKMAPELRLFMSLSGSAFMFHLTSRMFKEQPMPDVENVLKSDPELMKQFQNAAAKQYMMGSGGGAPNIAAPKPQQSSMGGDNMGLFSMVSNLFGSLNSDPISSEMPSYQQNNFSNKSANDVDNIINDVHNNISVEDDLDNRIETLSVSDEEITSIIEDTADIQILKKSGKKGANTRTLNI
jgi:hypothetical protein